VKWRTAWAEACIAKAIQSKKQSLRSIVFSCLEV
jgi:hypothetical protein